MNVLMMLVVAMGVTAWSMLAAQAAEEATPPAEVSAAPKCLQAVVNPVTGFAICVNPKGAAVEPPPQEASSAPANPGRMMTTPGPCTSMRQAAATRSRV